MDNKKLQKISEDVAKKIEKLHFTNAVIGGYDKGSVLENIQSICNIYEQYISNLETANEQEQKKLTEGLDEIQKKYAGSQCEPAKYTPGEKDQENNRNIKAVCSDNDIRNRDETIKLMIEAMRTSTMLLAEAGKNLELIRQKTEAESDGYIRKMKDKMDEIDAVQKKSSESLALISKSARLLAEMIDNLPENNKKD